MSTRQPDHSRGDKDKKQNAHELVYPKGRRHTPGEASRSQRLVASSVTRSRRRWRLLAAEDEDVALDADETEGDRFARADSFFSFSFSFSLPRFSSCLDRLLSCRLDLRSRDRDRERERRLRLSRVRSRGVLRLRRELFAESEGESCQCKRGLL